MNVMSRVGRVLALSTLAGFVSSSAIARGVEVKSDASVVHGSYSAQIAMSGVNLAQDGEVSQIGETGVGKSSNNHGSYHAQITMSGVNLAKDGEVSQIGDTGMGKSSNNHGSYHAQITMSAANPS